MSASNTPSVSATTPANRNWRYRTPVAWGTSAITGTVPNSSMSDPASESARGVKRAVKQAIAVMVVTVRRAAVSPEARA